MWASGFNKCNPPLLVSIHLLASWNVNGISQQLRRWPHPSYCCSFPWHSHTTFLVWHSYTLSERRKPFLNMRLSLASCYNHIVNLIFKKGINFCLPILFTQTGSVFIFSHCKTHHLAARIVPCARDHQLLDSYLNPAFNYCPLSFKKCQTFRLNLHWLHQHHDYSLLLCYFNSIQTSGTDKLSFWGFIYSWSDNKGESKPILM